MDNDFLRNRNFVDTARMFKALVFVFLIIMIGFPVWVIFPLLKNLI